MNFTRFRYWFLSAPITLMMVGIIIAWAMAAHQDSSSFYVIVGLIGILVLVAGIFGGEKLYQKFENK